MHDALHGRVGISHDDVTEQKRVELRGKVEAFLSEKAEVDIIPVESLAQIKETFYLFKEAQISLRSKAFAEFKHTNPEGMQHHQFLNGRKSELKEKKLSVKRLFQRMKECKQEIHQINCLLKTDNADELRFSDKKEWDSKEEFEEKKLRERCIP